MRHLKPKKSRAKNKKFVSLEDFKKMPIKEAVEFFAEKTGIDEERKVKLARILEKEKNK